MRNAYFSHTVDNTIHPLSVSTHLHANIVCGGKIHSFFHVTKAHRDGSLSWWGTHVCLYLRAALLNRFTVLLVTSCGGLVMARAPSISIPGVHGYRPNKQTNYTRANPFTDKIRLGLGRNLVCTVMGWFHFSVMA
jgi:hypothetical protein